MAVEIPVSDAWSRDLASEAKELSVTTAAVLAQHLKHDDELFREIKQDMKQGFADSAQSKHTLNNNMMGGFGELRASIAAIAAGVQSTADAATTRWLAVGGAAIVILLGAIGFLIANKGI